MTAQKIIWTALPNGFHEGAPRLSVFMSPRLASTTGKLEEFPDFMQWPTRINAMTFTVETAAGSVECRRISPDADLAIWEALFRPDTFIEPFEFRDFSAQAIRTLPVRGVTQYLSGLYSKVATVSPDVLPKLFVEDDDAEEEGGTLTPLLRDLGGILPVEVADLDGTFERVAGAEVDEETATLFALPKMMSAMTATMRAAPVTAPPLEELKTSIRFTALDPALQQVRAIDTRAEETHGFASKPALDFFQAHRFYDRPEQLEERVAAIDPKKAPPPPAPPKIDFHKMLSLLGDHPYLMRKLGIVVDLVAEGIPESGQMRVRARPSDDQPVADTTHVSPWTRYETTEGLFVASPEKDEMEDGMLRLDDANDDPDSTSTDYDLIQVDVDGAALKAVNLAVTATRGIAKQRLDIARKVSNDRVSDTFAKGVVRPELLAMRRLSDVREVAGIRELAAGRVPELVAAAEPVEPAETPTPAPTPPLPERSGVPPMRSAGIAVARAGRASEVAAKLDAAGVRNEQSDENEIVHFADNLVRGYRVDIFDDHTGQWHSLCHRIGTYKLEGRDGKALFLEAEDGSRDIHEEGYVKGSTTTSDGTGASDLYLHETMFRWDGWSLCAPRPGRTVRAEVDPDTGRQREVVERPQPQPATQFKMESSFRVEPGTLPRLRFGHTYKVRARCVDLAGNSLAPDEVGDVHASEEITYVRFDPVVPPLLVPRARFTEGESLNRMVIRSNYDATAREYVKKPEVEAALKGAEHTYAEANDRHVVPPKTSQQMAESHGAFDEWIGKGKTHQEAFELSTREAATLDHSHVVTGEDADGNPVYEPLEGSEHVPGRVPAGAPAGTPPAGGYLINTKERFPLAYLPDWLARGIVFRGLPGAEKPFVHRYEKEWPEREPIVVRIVERKGTLDPETCVQKFDDSGEPSLKDGVLTVPLPKGEVVRVKYGSWVEKGEYGRMGQQRWLREGDGGPAGLRDIVERGEHWMFTPSRELILVHAVQQPLCPPSFVLRRAEGATEPQALAATYRGLGDTFATLTGMIRLSVKTTGQVDVRASWKEPKDLLSDPTWKMVEGAALVASLPVHRRLQEPEVPFPFPDMDAVEAGTPWEKVLESWERLIGRRIRHEFGDTKHRWVDYRLVGTTRFREYFRPALTSDPKNLTREGPAVKLNVLSSARPDAPRVEYVVPSFRWEESVSEEEGWKVERKRVGGGLRVYLHRPWFSSGEGELLGVVLWTKGLQTLVSAENERFRGLVSMFGRDPIWSSGWTNAELDRSFFPPDRPQEEGLSLDETDAETVAVVGFAPEFDEKRKMWFCDVELGPKAQRSYYPFIRMALARYQPDSLPEAKISRVIQTDFAQVVPDRTLTVTQKAEREFDVTLFGPAPEAPYPNRVEVELQVHDGKVTGELGWTSMMATQEQPNPVILRRGFPDEASVPKDLPESVIRDRIFVESRIGTDVAVTLRGEPGTLVRAADVEPAEGEAEQPVVAVDAGAALHFARPVESRHLPVIDAREMVELLPKGVPDELVAKLPPMLLTGYETWSGSITVPEGTGKVRLLVCEFEHFAADDEVGKLDRDEVEPKIEGPYLDRVVYADTVELPV